MYPMSFSTICIKQVFMESMKKKKENFINCFFFTSLSSNMVIFYLLVELRIWFTKLERHILFSSSAKELMLICARSYKFIGENADYIGIIIRFSAFLPHYFSVSLFSTIKIQHHFICFYWFTFCDASLWRCGRYANVCVYLFVRSFSQLRHSWRWLWNFPIYFTPIGWYHISADHSIIIYRNSWNCIAYYTNCIFFLFWWSLHCNTKRLL